ncbi:Ti-type conjugative transfer relaxase TraA [Bradyrhizobium diazoefficiens]|uniref:Ti-type conjugative transfer relaxase TraA n=1 Tax=Bradyrhizobium diazoefficiens TaxID=1355477 RepID=UPI001B8B733A|nr:Ti-type conjugative transfer relaxase TraA [Bradyrhizobium diazoefficiens]MBR0868104.1 Ti-type conjugative transfer relaxase TraA [Bradyrhizobium diazoefficiens]MBR0892594.1 Ti-type conjugative transfer relaxase TraA [Bradyrhizobium diazoefficiens]MBR0924325.1 Ti-type conjugative transfer relaxase TraA [Bradyrhizobium diazoefficiens]
MAITHFTPQLIGRGDGRSAVLAAAYRHCAKMEFEAEGRTVDYSNKRGMAHEEFLVPADAPAWLRTIIADRSVAGASEAFWNKVEAFEKRADAQFAKEFIIALPVELTTEQNIALMRQFVVEQVLSRRQVADWVYHDEPGNPHVHLMTTLRPLTEDGFGPKRVAVIGEDGQPLRMQSGKIAYRLWAGDKQEFLEQRNGWLDLQNQHLALNGHEIRVDGRSYAERGIDVVPTTHIGVAAKAIQRRAEREGRDPNLERLRVFDENRAETLRRIQRRPEIVLDMISREKSVFDQRDVGKLLHRYVDDVGTFQDLMARVLQSPGALRLEGESVDFATGARAPAKYTTRELIRLEAEMARRADHLSGSAAFTVKAQVIAAVSARHANLSVEQRAAIAHVVSGERIAAVVGRAGAGKTTMMRAAREVWEAAGYRVVGGALAGKAAEGLEKEAAIQSRTLASWELRWKSGRDGLDDRTVFVLDEAGMVASRQMALFVETASKAGSKLVLVGDPEQLQPIEAGAAFRAIVERIGYAELETIYRQRQQWMRDASLDLARGRTGEALSAYRHHGRLFGSELKAQAIDNLIADWNRDYDPSKSTLILAHLRRDVRALNDMARAKLVERGLIEEGHAFRTEDGERRFAAGDQIVFLKNEGSLGVKNGMIGKVVAAEPKRLVAEIGEGEGRRHVEVDQRFYRNIDHGYATTVHKAQGATVDRVKVLATLSLDKHLTYVALTRHREDVALYYGRRSFQKAGGLIPILSQRRAKETTLDYECGALYRDALRFAANRGLNIFKVARTLANDRLRWTVRQKQRLADVARRLRALGEKLGLLDSRKPIIRTAHKEAKPMVAGVTTFTKSLTDTVEDRILADPAIKKQWEDVSTRFRLVFADPERAFRATNFDAMLKDPAAASSTMARLAASPESFGALRGKVGLLAGKSDKQVRQRAEANAPALKRDIERYLRLRAEAEHKHEAEERAIRHRVAIDIPALSREARRVLERVRDAIDRNDLPSALEFALADRMVKAEIDGFNKAVAERFGDRTFLSNAAREPNGQPFEKAAAGMDPARREQLKEAWPAMRAAQQLAAGERTAQALKQAEGQRLTQSQGQTLK